MLEIPLTSTLQTVHALPILLLYCSEICREILSIEIQIPRGSDTGYIACSEDGSGYLPPTAFLIVHNL